MLYPITDRQTNGRQSSDFAGSRSSLFDLELVSRLFATFTDGSVLLCITLNHASLRQLNAIASIQRSRSHRWVDTKVDVLAGSSTAGTVSLETFCLDLCNNGLFFILGHFKWTDLSANNGKTSNSYLTGVSSFGSVQMSEINPLLMLNLFHSVFAEWVPRVPTPQAIVGYLSDQTNLCCAGQIHFDFWATLWPWPYFDQLVCSLQWPEKTASCFTLTMGATLPHWVIPSPWHKRKS